MFGMEISPEEEATATTKLLEDMRLMLDNPKYSDVRFKCEDCVQVHASRMLIMGRSPVLGSIVSVERTSQTRQAEISLPYVTSEALLAVLEFLYTATMLKHAPQTSAQAYQIFKAACYFQLPQLMEMVVEFLMDSMTGAEDDASKAALRLSVALESDWPLPRVSSEISSFVGVLKSVKLEFAQLQCLSEKAFRYFLQTTQHKSNEIATSCFGEYLRFRQVLLWCALQVKPYLEATMIVNCAVLDLRSAQRFVQNSSTHRNAESQWANDLSSVLADLPDSAVTVRSLLSLVDFRRIHAKLLGEIVEPLGIVPEAQLMEAFRSQALLWSAPRAEPRAEHGSIRWEHGNSYRTEGDGTKLAKHDPEVGFARFCVPITAAYVVYEWDIIFKKRYTQFWEIGLYVAENLESGRSSGLTGKTLSEQPGSLVLRHTFLDGLEINQNNGCWTKFGKDSAHKNAKVTVRLDLWERCCSFSVDGDGFLEAWANLPEGVYYPAVSLGKKKGKVRIQLGNGFDMV